MDRVERFLAHYSSPYYDPAKAHQYYEEHKQASDKAAASALTSKEQRDTFAVSKSNIDKARKTETTAYSAAEVARLKSLSDNAKAAATRISDSLKALEQSLKNGRATLKVNEIPANATPQQRAFLEAQNKILRAKAANADQAKYRTAAGQASIDRTKVVSDLNAAITKARNDYHTGMIALQTKYQGITDAEKLNIHNQVAGAPPKVAAAVKKAAAKKISSHKRTKK